MWSIMFMSLLWIGMFGCAAGGARSMPCATPIMEGAAVPGLVRGPTGLWSPTVQGLALGFSRQTMDYTKNNLCNPCEWVSESMVKLAEVVVAGLHSIAS